MNAQGLSLGMEERAMIMAGPETRPLMARCVCFCVFVCVCAKSNVVCSAQRVGFLSDPGVPGVRSMGPVLSH